MKVTTYLKPLSVNQAWQGRRFKTPSYKKYEEDLKLVLPNLLEIPDGKLGLIMEVGYSSSASDIDNFLKPYIDVLQKKYEIFNDNRIYDLHVIKTIVKKGYEFVSFEFRSLEGKESE